MEALARAQCAGKRPTFPLFRGFPAWRACHDAAVNAQAHPPLDLLVVEDSELDYQLLVATLSLQGWPSRALRVDSLPALGAAFVWASYSLLTQRVPAFPTAAIGLFALVSGVLSLACHFWLEPAVQLSTADGLWLLLMGLGPLGAAFYLWDAALKRGDPQQIGLLSFLTPLLSTLLLLWDRGQVISPSVAGAAVLIVGAAWLGRSKPQR